MGVGMVSVCALALCAVSVLPSVPDVPLPFDPVAAVRALDVELVAHIVVGEVGGRYAWTSVSKRWHAIRYVSWVVRNQAASNRFPAGPYDPREQFYAWQPVVTTVDLLCVRAALAAPAKSDPTRGALFVLSEADRRWLKLPPGDIVLLGAVPGVALHFYREWPKAIAPMPKADRISSRPATP